MTWLQKVFGFQGRIGRRDYWIIQIGILVADWLVMAFRTYPYTPPALLSAEDPVTRAYAAAAVLQANWVNTLLGLMLLWPCLAAAVKRCHDRNRSGLWLVAFWGPALVSGVTGVIVRSLWLMWVYGLTGPLYGWPAGPFLTASTVAFILWLWGFVELGLLPGSARDNKYGPPPVSDDDTAPAAA
jgi:uncharacterized membrane protein YhaH (DUF805 family)